MNKNNGTITNHCAAQGVVIIIIKNGRYLLIKQSKDPFKGFWGPVHGKIEEHETISQAIIREAKEEIGATVVPIRKLWESTADYGADRLHWWLVKCGEESIKINTQEISEYNYFLPSQLPTLKLFPMTEIFFATILGKD